MSDYRPATNPDPMQGYTRPAPTVRDWSGDECIGACGQASCEREDCQQCEACTAYFDRDVEGRSCDRSGYTCGDCPAYYCRGECCAPDPDRWRD